MAADAPQPASRLPFSFTGTIDPTRVSWAYRGGLLVVALAMLLLPLVYLGVIGLAGAGVWWHVTRHAWWIQGGGGLQWRLIAYIAPALAGTMVTFFMIKPVFARRPAGQEPLAVTAAEHPALFAFIAQICRHVRAPMPQLVQIDCQVNASASFAPGLHRVIRRDLVLTIGLPLVHALSVRELGGVLAHEFGHFAQGSGLRLTMLVRGINAWFSRVVHERDSWDDRLDAWLQAGDARVALLVLPSRAGVWLSRQVLRLLMIGGHVISCFMTREMEYDADSYEVKIAGSQAFASTMGRLRDLNLAMAHSLPYIQRELAARRLPADLPLFLVTWQRSKALRPEVANDTPSGHTSWFDTHPSDADRLAAAARANDRGILFGGNDAATRLFRDFDGLSLTATRHHYDERGLLDDVSLVDAVDSVQASVGREERQQAVRAIFDLGLSRFRPLRVPVASAAPSPAVDVQTWRFPDALERFDDRMKQRTGAFAAQEVFHAEYGVFDPARFGLSEWTLEAAVASEREAIEKIGLLHQVIEPYERVRLQRVACGLERLAGLGHEKYTPANLQAFVQALDTAASALDIGFEVARLGYARGVLTQLVETSPQSQTTRDRRDQLTPLVNDAMARMRQVLAGAPCPALLGARPATLEEACKLQDAGADPMRAFVAVETMYSNLLLEVCWLALRGEAIEAVAPA